MTFMEWETEVGTYGIKMRGQTERWRREWKQGITPKVFAMGELGKHKGAHVGADLKPTEVTAIKHAWDELWQRVYMSGRNPRTSDFDSFFDATKYVFDQANERCEAHKTETDLRENRGTTWKAPKQYNNLLTKKQSAELQTKPNGDDGTTASDGYPDDFTECRDREDDGVPYDGNLNDQPHVC